MHIHCDRSINFLQQSSLNLLRNWFISQQRDLPWRNNPSPYAVWISEVMLQQTQVAVVIPYFERWMNRFPSIHHLAEAPVEDVLKEWEGLGYYSRARNLHTGARYILDNYQGELPCSAEKLGKIKGLGPYTVGAILNFAFHKKAPAVDGNVLRVLARYYGITDDIGKPKTFKLIESLTQNLLPEEDPWIISEALIELGATTCNRQPKCIQCPLQKDCQAHLKGITDTLPVKSPKVATTLLYRNVAIISDGNKLLISRGSKGKVMEDLYEFPYFETESINIKKPAHDNNRQITQQKIKEHLGINTDWQQTLPEIRHSFTRYRALLFPHIFKMTSTKIKEITGFEWHSLDSLNKLPFSSGHRRIVKVLQEKKTDSTIDE